MRQPVLVAIIKLDLLALFYLPILDHRHHRFPPLAAVLGGQLKRHWHEAGIAPC